MKKVVKVLVIILVVVVAVLIAALVMLNSAVKKGVETMGPQLTRTEVTLADVKISPLTGNARINGLVVGNPEGFKTPHAIKVDGLRVGIDPKSVLSDKIVVKEIVVEGPEVIFEAGLKGTNLGRILKNLEGDVPEPETEQPEKEEPAEGGKKVVIDDFLLKEGKIKVSSTLMQGTAVPVPLPTIHLEGIGEETDGASLAEVITTVFTAILEVVVQAAANSGELLGDGAELVGDAATKGAEVVGDAAGAVGGAATKGLKAVGVDKGAKAVGDTATKGAKAAGEAADEVTDAAKKVFSGALKGLKKED